jgi:hypothetical protein
MSEKISAMIERGLTNSRLKDYYDLWYLGKHFDFEGQAVRSAIVATLSRRKFEIPAELPAGLTAEYAAINHSAWPAFWRKAEIQEALIPLGEIVLFVRDLVWPALRAAGDHEPWPARWAAGGPWKLPENPSE